MEITHETTAQRCQLDVGCIISIAGSCLRCRPQRVAKPVGHHSRYGVSRVSRVSLHLEISSMAAILRKTTDPFCSEQQGGQLLSVNGLKPGK
jgi:hypothetical protein